eukprot:1181096-Prorocentrum_minimum.AAC.2
MVEQIDKVPTAAEPGKVMTEAEYARKYRPYQPLPEGESVPAMSELWAYANRKYSRYSSYAWGGVIVVGGVAYLLGQQFGTKKEKKEDV